ncbi:glycosyltransferase family 39 protein [Planctomyces sp. SH-PL62]|uniref:glycosyltransferase family 39 protein n=1 Tax=Planctomyces sp. SH-PL62 TaxID=1636152 RepID=UPI00078D7967|nr:glycosyltransferase family 39 protein [Planctomyces sp. SH-PL62]AMV37131.1 Dolichyl-phosphate-mannose-protein mannosyltransferase [Planctomyces sp. SH-PL62]
MMVLSFLSSNVLVLLGAWWCATRVLRQPHGPARILAVGVLAWTWVTVGVQLLGTLGFLNVPSLLGWSLAAAVLGLACARTWPGRGVDADHGPPAEPEPIGWEGWLAVGLAIWGALVLGTSSLLMPVKVVSDGPIYHLYFAARWWQAGRLFLVASPFGESAATYFPANGDLWFAWLMATWGGDRLARVGQAPFLGLACIAAFGCARELGAGRTASLVATSLFATVGPLVLFTFEANVDTIFVAGYLTAAYFFLRFAEGRDGWPALLLGGLAAGEALGTKSVGNLFVPPLLLAGCWAVARRTRAVRPTLAGLATILTGVATTSGFWYARNALLTGNPLYPLTVKLGGATWLSGWYGSEAMRGSIYYIPVSNWRALVDTLVGVLDARTVPLWVAAVLGVWAVGRGRRRGDGWVWIFSLGVVLNVALYWLFIPYRTQQRFMLQGVGLAVVPLASLLDRSRWLRIAATLMLALHVATPQSWPFGPRDADVPWDLTPQIPNAIPPILPLASELLRLASPRSGFEFLSALDVPVLAVVAGLIVWAGARLRRGRPDAATWMAGLAAIGLSAVVGWSQIVPFAGDRRLLAFPAFPDFYRGWIELDARSGPTGSRIAYAGTNIPYYLMGSGLRNNVRYVNVEGPPHWLMHDFHRRARAEGRGEWPNARPGWDRERPDYDAWLANLRAEAIQLLVVTRVNPGEGAHNVADAEGFPVERQWADSHPETFEPLYGVREGDPWFRLYRVRGGIEPSAPADSNRRADRSVTPGGSS